MVLKIYFKMYFNLHFKLKEHGKKLNLKMDFPGLTRSLSNMERLITFRLDNEIMY